MRPPTEDPDDAGVATRILERLQDKGALGTGALAQHVKLYPARARKALQALAAKGLIHSTGTRASQAWHLGAAGKRQPGKPAKEAP